jgi:hypothetical protein
LAKTELESVSAESGYVDPQTLAMKAAKVHLSPFSLCIFSLSSKGSPFPYLSLLPLFTELLSVLIYCYAARESSSTSFLFYFIDVFFIGV